MAGAGGAALAVVVVVSRAGHATRHPDPRPGMTAELVLPPGMVPHTPGSIEAYVAARTVPAVMDGLYCHCNCSRTFGPRSLPTCFESEHAAYCGILMDEGATPAAPPQTT